MEQQLSRVNVARLHVIVRTAVTHSHIDDAKFKQSRDLSSPCSWLDDGSFGITAVNAKEPLLYPMRGAPPGDKGFIVHVSYTVGVSPSAVFRTVEGDPLGWPMLVQRLRQDNAKTTSSRPYVLLAHVKKQVRYLVVMIMRMRMRIMMLHDAADADADGGMWYGRGGGGGVMMMTVI